MEIPGWPSGRPAVWRKCWRNWSIKQDKRRCGGMRCRTGFGRPPVSTTRRAVSAIILGVSKLRRWVGGYEAKPVTPWEAASGGRAVVRRSWVHGQSPISGCGGLVPFECSTSTRQQGLAVSSASRRSSGRQKWAASDPSAVAQDGWWVLGSADDTRNRYVGEIKFGWRVCRRAGNELRSTISSWYRKGGRVRPLRIHAAAFYLYPEVCPVDGVRSRRAGLVRIARPRR